MTLETTLFWAPHTVLGRCLQLNNNALSHTDSTCRVEVKGHGTRFLRTLCERNECRYATSSETELHQQMNYKSNTPVKLYCVTELLLRTDSYALPELPNIWFCYEEHSIMSLALYFNHIPDFFNQTPRLLYFFAAHFYVATIQGWLLFEGGYHSKVAIIRGWLPFKGGYYSRVATIQGWLLFEGSIYFFGKRTSIKNYWIRYIRAIHWQLLDAVNSTRSLSVKLSAVKMSHTTPIALALAWWPSSEIVCMHV